MEKWGCVMRFAVLSPMRQEKRLCPALSFDTSRTGAAGRAEGMRYFADAARLGGRAATRWLDAGVAVEAADPKVDDEVGEDDGAEADDEHDG